MTSPNDSPPSETDARREHRIELANFLFRTAPLRGGVVEWWAFELPDRGTDGKFVFRDPLAVDFGTDPLQSENSMHLHFGVPGDHEDVDVVTVVAAPDARSLDGFPGWSQATVEAALSEYWRAHGLDLSFRYSREESTAARDEAEWAIRGGPAGMLSTEAVDAADHPRALLDGSADT